MSAAEIAAHFERLVKALEARQRPHVVSICCALLDRGASVGKRWHTIATLLFHSGEPQRALDAMQRFVKTSQNSPHAQFEQAAMAAQAGKLEFASSILQNLPRGPIDQAALTYLRGTVAMNMGRFDDAKIAFNNALEANALLGQAMLQLSIIDDLDIGSQTADRIISVHSTIQNAQPVDQMQHQYALGRVHASRGDFDRAFAAFSAGAGIGQSMRPYDARADDVNARAGLSGYSAATISDISERMTSDTSRPIFVTGIARSGTTLVEQIIASHTRVVGGEELNKMRLVASDLGGADALSLNAYGERNGFDSIADNYLHLASQRFGYEGRFVDKSLDASRFMGLIAAVVPHAPIIWVRRDPLDCAISAFQTYFADGLDWSWRLEDIAHHFKVEDMLFNHWKQLLDSRILLVRYEDLVTEPNYEIARILAHCSLLQEPGPFAAHLTERSVATASAAQVRKPINNKAIGRAQHYRRHLAPFSDAYFDKQLRD